MPEPNYAWLNDFVFGSQNPHLKGGYGYDVYALAVHEGNVSAPVPIPSASVPIPSAVWLLGSGLIGLIELKREYLG